MTKVVVFNGSPRSEGNTRFPLRQMLQELEAESITTEIVQIGGEHIRGYTACMNCFENRNKRKSR